MSGFDQSGQAGVKLCEFMRGKTEVNVDELNKEFPLVATDQTNWNERVKLSIAAHEVRNKYEGGISDFALEVERFKRKYGYSNKVLEEKAGISHANAARKNSGVIDWSDENKGKIAEFMRQVECGEIVDFKYRS